MRPERPLIVVGPRNPGTDSVCAAIAYAHLKSSCQGVPANPFRAGSLNPQTIFALSHLGAESPTLLTDVYPRIGDVMVQKDELIMLREDDTLHDAQDIITRKRFSFLPVSDQQGKCLGQITAVRLAKLTEDIAENCQKGEISFDVEKFVSAVGGRVVTKEPLPGKFTGKLVIRGVGGSDPTKATGPFALITSLNEDVIKIAAGGEVEVIVACGGGGVSPETLEAVEEKGAHLIISPKDVFGTALHTFMAMQLKHFLDRGHPTFKHYDRVKDVQQEIGKHNEGGFIVLDDNGSARGVITRVNFLTENRFRVVLVDHNDFAQAVEGTHEAEVVEIIDHHRLGNRSTNSPITFINKAVGATCTIIAELYKSGGHTPDSRTAGLMLSGIISDTSILKTSSTTPLDRDMANWLAAISGLDIESYGEEMFASGTVTEGASLEQLIKRDMKKYAEGDCKMSVSRFETVGFKMFEESEDEFRNVLAKVMEQQGCQFSCLMVTDIVQESSLLLCVGDERIMASIGYPRRERGLYEMQGVVSRSKQLMPYLVDIARKLT